MNTKLIPEIKKIEITGGIIAIADYFLTDEFLKAAPVSAELFEEIGGGKGNKPVKLILDSKYDKEEYTLTIDQDMISVEASTSSGAYYALCTIAQLSQLNNGMLECCKISDWPTIKVRGVSDDISRGQISSLENFKSIIKRLSRYKCNLYMPYIEDSFAYKCAPQSGKYSDAVSACEWKELVTYADKYYVTIVPIVNILGHWDKNSVLEAFEDYMLKEGDNPEGRTLSTLDVRKPRVLEMVSHMLDEITEVFGKAGMIHVGGDEVGDLTRLFSKEKAAELFNGYYKHIHNELKKRGCRMLIYSDMYTPVWGDYQIGLDYIDEMPEDTGFVYWDYAVRKEYKNITHLIERGKRFYVSPATYTWSRFIPHIQNVWLNVKSLAGLAPDKYEGIIMSTWCDGGMNLREENWLGILAGALFGWEPKSKMTLDEYIESFFNIYYGIENINLKEFHNLFDYDKAFIKEDYNENTATKPMEFWYDELQGIGSRMFNEFWKDARSPVDETLKAGLNGVLQQILKARSYFEELKPSRNTLTYEVMLFDFKRLVANIKKIDLLRSDAYRSREEAMRNIPKILELAEEVSSLREENKKLWFAANRQSEWEFTESKYLDLESTLRSLARYCKVGKRLSTEKYL